MGTVKLDQAGLKQLRHMMEQRVLLVQMELAREAMYFLLNFGYHALQHNHPGPFKKNESEQGWTEYYAANWNIGIGTPDQSVLSPEREVVEPPDQADKYTGELFTFKQNGYYDGVISTVKKGQSIFVTNSVYYGQWLNDGGFLEPTYVGRVLHRESVPNRFIELCRDHLDGQKDRIIKESKEAIPL